MQSMHMQDITEWLMAHSSPTVDLMPKIVRITTVPLSLQVLLRGQLAFMKSRGFDVTMISSDGAEVPSLVEQEGCPHMVVTMTRTISPWRDFLALVKLVRILRRIRPEIVHTHTPKAGIIGMLAALIAGVPHRLHTVAGMPLLEAKGAVRRILDLVEKLTYRCATHVYPNSKGLEAIILSLGFCKPSKLKCWLTAVQWNRYRSFRPCIISCTRQGFASCQPWH